MVSHHPAKFGGNKHCGSGNINNSANTVALPQMRDAASATVFTLLMKTFSQVQISDLAAFFLYVWKDGPGFKVLVRGSRSCILLRL